jgi:hypothetical protein
VGGGGGRGIDAHARRTEPLEPGQGSLLGAPARGAGMRGQIRPSPGRPFPARGRLRALASRQTPAGLPLRSARGHTSRGARGDLRRAWPERGGRRWRNG